MGEWKVRKHGAGKHRTWMKMHVVMDAKSQQIKGVRLTPNSEDDSTGATPLIASNKYKVGSPRDDGAYDKHAFRKLLKQKEMCQIIQPQSNAENNNSRLPHLRERNRTVKRIGRIGRKKWKEQNGYHQRSKIETAMFRYKMIIGDHLAARKNSHHETEVAIGCKILNVMLQVAKLISIKVS